MRTNLRSSKLAAKLSIRQVEALSDADVLGDQLDAAVNAWWREVVTHLRDSRRYNLPLEYHVLVRHFRLLRQRLWITASDVLMHLTLWGHATAVAPLRHALDADAITSAALQAPVPLQEREAEPAERLSKEERWQRAKEFLFPPPDPAEVRDIVYSGDWQERLASITAKAAPEVLAQAVITGAAAGENVQQLAARVLPEVDGVRSSARRLARTEGMRVAHESQMRAWDGLGTMCVGFQVHATLDGHTRPWHAARSGRVYYKEPAEGQPGQAQMPRPPMEADDPSQRPAGTPRVAFN